MPRPLEVYGFTDLNPDHANVKGAQVRVIVAAHSVAEVMRITGIPRSTWNWTGSTTANEGELAVAMAEPGVAFMRSLNDYRGEWVRFIPHPPKSEPLPYSAKITFKPNPVAKPLSRPLVEPRIPGIPVLTEADMNDSVLTKQAQAFWAGVEAGQKSVTDESDGGYHWRGYDEITNPYDGTKKERRPNG